MKNTNIDTIIALLIIDLMSDILFLSSLNIATEQEDEETDNHPLIGKRYIVSDCSYAIDKESGVRVGGLHGKEYVIVSDPYVDEVRDFGRISSHLFVDVFSIRSARKYRVLFQENDVIED